MRSMAPHRFPLQRVLRLVNIGAGITAALTLLYLLSFYFLLDRYITAPPLADLAKWLLVGLSPWVLTVPFGVWLGERLPLQWHGLSARGSIHVLVGVAVTVIHLAWFWAWSEGFAPYVHLREDYASVNHYLRYHAVVDLLLYASVIVVAGRAALQGFRATPDGLLRTAGVAADRSEDISPGDLGFESRPAPALVYDPVSLAIHAVNQAAVECYGYPALEFQTKTLRDLFRQDDLAQLTRGFETHDQLVLWTREAIHRRANGDLMQVEYFNHRVLFSGRPAMLLLVHDVTEKARVREALRVSERDAAELRAQLADAQLRALKLQLKPHFLFNILNTVAMMIRSGETGKAQSVVTLLGEMFRRFLEIQNADKTTLEQELSFLDLYLGLEEFRFEDRVELHRRIDPAVLGALVPTLVLQPLAENAVKHGIARIVGRCRLDVNAYPDGDELVLEIVNDAPQSASVGGLGIGLENTRARLRNLYGGKAHLSLTPLNGRITATVRLPREALA